MTDNEKAATFIGWKPERVCCAPYYGEQRGRVYRVIPCEHGYRSDHVVDETAAPSRLIHWRDPTPDMSRPENYMRALGLLYREAGRVNQEALLAAVARALFNDDAGEVVSYLAALYDKEHSA